MNQRGDEKRRLILQFIQERVSRDGYPPSVREIGEGVGLSSPSSVHQHLKRLERDGFILFDEKHKKRALRLSKNTPGLQPPGSIPLLARAPVGESAFTVGEIEDYIPFKPAIGSTEDLFALRMQGESMIGAGMLNGDVIIVKRGTHARNGDIVVALLDNGEVTVKRFYREEGRYCLGPENSGMKPVYVSELSIVGRVTALIRHF